MIRDWYLKQLSALAEELGTVSVQGVLYVYTEITPQEVGDLFSPLPEVQQRILMGVLERGQPVTLKGAGSVEVVQWGYHFFIRFPVRDGDDMATGREIIAACAFNVAHGGQTLHLN